MSAAERAGQQVTGLEAGRSGSEGSDQIARRRVPESLFLCYSSNIPRQRLDLDFQKLKHLGSSVCCFWMALKFHCKLKNAQIAKHVLLQSFSLVSALLSHEFSKNTSFEPLTSVLFLSI